MLSVEKGSADIVCRALLEHPQQQIIGNRNSITFDAVLRCADPGNLSPVRVLYCSLRYLKKEGEVDIPAGIYDITFKVNRDFSFVSLMHSSFDAACTFPTSISSTKSNANRERILRHG